MKADMTEVEGENERLQVILKQKENEINDIRKVSSIPSVKTFTPSSKIDHRDAAERTRTTVGHHSTRVR